MSHFWPEGQPIVVILDNSSLPTSFQWRGGEHIVTVIANQWRIDDLWWQPRRIWREFFKVYTNTGWLAILYHDLVSNTWFLQRLYD